MKKPRAAGDGALRTFAKHGGMLRTARAIRLGIHPRTLYALCDAGQIERVSRGLYRLASAPPLISPDLTSIAVRVPKAVICLISALVHHGLTTQIPHAIDIALPSHSRIPAANDVPFRVFWFSEPSLSAGVQVEAIDGVSIRVYSPEKTIADCFKYRNKIGIDVAVEALKLYRERTRKPNYRALAHYAEINRVRQVMRPYLEAVL